jgi:hypothetical protein
MTTASDSVASQAGRRWLHLFLFTMQTVGAVIFYWKGLASYQQLTADPTAHVPRHDIRLWSLLAIALIQVGYWVHYRIGRAQPQIVSAALGHIMLFLSRMVFTLPAAMFSFVFVSKKLESALPVLGYILLIAVLFSLFLYTRELQWLGNAFMHHETPKTSLHD